MGVRERPQAGEIRYTRMGISTRNQPQKPQPGKANGHRMFRRRQDHKKGAREDRPEDQKDSGKQELSKYDKNQVRTQVPG